MIEKLRNAGSWKITGILDSSVEKLEKNDLIVWDEKDMINFIIKTKKGTELGVWVKKKELFKVLKKCDYQQTK
jgi:hypothetical protein